MNRAYMHVWSAGFVCYLFATGALEEARRWKITITRTP